MPEHQDEAERSWFEYKRLVLAELTRIDKGVLALNEKMEKAMDTQDINISKMRVEIAMLKVQASIWGAGSGIIVSAVVTVVIAILFKH
jgi:hypothetical protein